jgi:hypothetical protein
MSFVLEFLPEAFAEIECVTGDYEARAVGLGARFRREVESACAAIVQLRCFGDCVRQAIGASIYRVFHTTSLSSPTSGEPS